MAKKTTPVTPTAKQKVVTQESEVDREKREYDEGKNTRKQGQPEIFDRVPTVRHQYVEEKALDDLFAGFTVKDADKIGG